MMLSWAKTLKLSDSELLHYASLEEDPLIQQLVSAVQRIKDDADDQIREMEDKVRNIECDIDEAIDEQNRLTKMLEMDRSDREQDLLTQLEITKQSHSWQCSNYESELRETRNKLADAEARLSTWNAMTGKY